MEIVVSSFIQPLIQPLMSCIGTPVIRQFGYLFKADENVKKLIKLAVEVEDNKKHIEDKIDAAIRDGKQCTDEVLRWIRKIEDPVVEVTQVQSDHYEQRGRCWPNCWSSYKIGRRASKLLIKLTDLENERAAFLDHLTIDAPPASVQQMSSTSYVALDTFTSNMKKICEYLEEEEKEEEEEEETDGVIGIWGMGGVGKTTLLKAINDNFLNNNGLYDHVIFIVVPKEDQIENLQKIIIKKLGLPSSEDLVVQAQIIFEYLKDKNFLLLLDDIWEVVHLKRLGIPYSCQVGSSSSGRRFRRKVVFTTRSKKVCNGMDCPGRIIKVECLQENEAWILFKEMVGKDIIDLPGIRSRAKEVAKECGGLPLALVVIGRAMATKESPQKWDDALTQLRKSQHNNIPCLVSQSMSSYDSLPDDKIRGCFLCCSLWPEDFKINKEELIMCWIGLGLIDDFKDINEAYERGYSFIRSLTAASLLEPIQDRYDVIKVHDLIRDLALWIACDSGTNRNRWLVKAGVGLEEVPSEVVAKWRVAKWVSLMKNKIKELPPRLPMCHNLLTLILRENRELTRIPIDFFTSMPNLTFLDLCNTGLRKIPKEICGLSRLRYLNMSYTYISSLPTELKKLQNLKYLLLRTTNLRGEVSRGVIGSLLKLEYLDLYPDGFVETEELLRLRLLKGVGMKITSEHALQQLSRVVPIRHLAIEEYKGGDSSTTSNHLLLSSCTQQSLREWKFSKCRSIMVLVVDVEVRLPRLESLELRELENLTEIMWKSVLPPSECFERLRRLIIGRCDGLKDITWVLHLPCLEVLILFDCKEMEQVVFIGGGGEVRGASEERAKVTKPPTFPRLRDLYLWGLPKLAMICDNYADAAVNFPSLERLEVFKCNELKKLPFHPQPLINNYSKLKRIRGGREWWEGVEWESDQSAEPSLLRPYFRESSGPLLDDAYDAEELGVAPELHFQPPDAGLAEDEYPEEYGPGEYIGAGLGPEDEIVPEDFA